MLTNEELKREVVKLQLDYLASHAKMMTKFNSLLEKIGIHNLDKKHLDENYIKERSKNFGAPGKGEEE